MNHPKLIHLNGAAGIGKDTIAQRYIDDNPLALCIRSDELIVQLGQWQDNYDPARHLAFDLLLQMAATHLRAGHDVIVPHLLTDLEEAEALEKVAQDQHVQFVEIVLSAGREDALERVFARGTRGEPGAPPLTQADRPEFEELYDNVQVAVGKRPQAVIVNSVRDDIDDTYKQVVKAITG
jgi:predicted kinase